MMHELEPTFCEMIRPLFPDSDVHLAVRALLAGNVPGQVYVDDPRHPRAALARIGYRFYLGGSPGEEAFNREMGRFFAETVYPKGRAAGQEGFVVKCTTAGWVEQADVLLPGKMPIPEYHHYYAGREVCHNWRAMLPPDVTIRPVDRALLAADLEGLDDLREEMQSERPSVAEFLDKSFGLVPVRENEVIGWCLSEYNCGDRCEVGIATAEAYRRRGLATLLSTAFIEHARARGIDRIGWHCNADNAASNATALKVGLRQVAAYPAYLCLFDEVVHLAVHGNRHFEQQEYAEAAVWYDRALEHGEAPIWVYLNGACAHAMAGGGERALQRLHEALDRGFVDVEYLRTRRWFDGLRGTAAWDRLIRRVEERDHE